MIGSLLRRRVVLNFEEKESIEKTSYWKQWREKNFKKP